jgi:hypothetical protein
MEVLPTAVAESPFRSPVLVAAGVQRDDSNIDFRRFQVVYVIGAQISSAFVRSSMEKAATSAAAAPDVATSRRT